MHIEITKTITERVELPYWLTSAVDAFLRMELPQKISAIKLLKGYVNDAFPHTIFGLREAKDAVEDRLRGITMNGGY